MILSPENKLIKKLKTRIFDINNTRKLLSTQMIQAHYYLHPWYKLLFIGEKLILPKSISQLSFILFVSILSCEIGNRCVIF